MLTLLILGFSSFFVAVVCTPLCRDLAIRWGLVDHPDHIRKLHTKAIPRIGGIPIFIAYLVSFAILLLSTLPSGHMIRSHFVVVRSLFPAAMIVFLTGLLDDLLGLKPWQKFCAQFVAAAVAVWSGVQIMPSRWHQFPSWLAIPVTVVWLVGCTNAFNLIDGVDGLAAGVGLLATTIDFDSGSPRAQHWTWLLRSFPSLERSWDFCASTSILPPFFWATRAASLLAFFWAVTAFCGARSPLLSWA